jgi:hypothetical protein
LRNFSFHVSSAAFFFRLFFWWDLLDLRVVRTTGDHEQLEMLIVAHLTATASGLLLGRAAHDLLLFVDARSRFWASSDKTRLVFVLFTHLFVLRH